MAAFDVDASFAMLFGVAQYDSTSSFDSMSWIAHNLTALKHVLTDPDLIGRLMHERPVHLNAVYKK